MPRPQVVVTIAAAPSRRGVETTTGNAFLVYPASNGSSDPQRFTSATAAAAVLPATPAQYVADLLTQGAPSVTAVRANVEPVNATAASQTTWADALSRLSVASFGVGQVLIPGVASTAAYSALAAHAVDTGRVPLFDVDSDATAAEAKGYRDTVKTNEGATRGGVFAGWIEAPGDGNTTRQIPASVAAAGLAARMDGRAGHAGRQPAGTQEFGDAGRVYGATGVTVSYSDDDLDLLADNGVNPFIVRDGAVYLWDWVAATTDDRWRQLNYGRLAMQITTGTADLLGQFLFRPIDGKGKLFAEVEAAIDGYLLGLYNAGAVYGDTSDEAYVVDVKGVTTIEDVRAGTIRAALEVAFTPGARRVVFNITVQRPGEVGGA